MTNASVLSRALPPRLTRRQRQLLALYQGRVPRVAGAPPRVAVVGAGLAGLTAAHLLTLAGCQTAVFEADKRVGGRIRTEWAQPGVWEMGGEFIDSDHDDMRALAACFGLELLDTALPGEDALGTAYRFGGEPYSGAQVLAAFADVAPRIAADVARISARPGHRSKNPADRHFDRLTLAEYLDGLRVDRWLRDLLDVAYVTLYGLDAGEQSALNFLTMIGTDTSEGFEVFGSSDERFKVRAGSQHLTDALAARLGSRVYLDQRLVRLAKRGASWLLTLQSGGATVDVPADAVVLAIPFTLLRTVELGDLLPPVQQHAVESLGYGMNSKLMLGTRQRLWREHGCDGGVYTDTSLQTSWDCSRLRGGDSGVFTAFLGGQEGVALGRGSEREQGQRVAALADAVFPGFTQQWTLEARRAHWPTEPFALGSYTCYRPGQWTDFGGTESKPLAGGVYFAGEHCATSSQGYMNGAAETGRAAALAIIRRAK